MLYNILLCVVYVIVTNLIRSSDVYVDTDVMKPANVYILNQQYVHIKSVDNTIVLAFYYLNNTIRII